MSDSLFTTTKAEHFRHVYFNYKVLIFCRFSGIPQNISDGSCATQYKMAVDGVSGSCSEVNLFIHDSSGDEQPYITHINDSYFHTKFKIDPNDLYTFHDSDVIAGEITVSHTDDNFIFSDADVKPKLLDSPNKEIDLIETLTNGEIKEEKEEIIQNGHYSPVNKTNVVKQQTGNFKDNKTNTKVLKAKSQSQINKETTPINVTEIRRLSVHSPKGACANIAAASKTSVNSVNTNSVPSNIKGTSTASKSGGETFLDVFKREQGLVESPPAVIKTESPGPSMAAAPPPKISAPVAKKAPSGNLSILFIYYNFRLNL